MMDFFFLLILFARNIFGKELKKKYALTTEDFSVEESIEKEVEDVKERILMNPKKYFIKRIIFDTEKFQLSFKRIELHEDKGLVRNCQIRMSFFKDGEEEIYLS
jgi:hypothetical protein